MLAFCFTYAWLFLLTSEKFFFRGRICGNVNRQKRSNKKKRGRSGRRNRPASQRRPASGVVLGYPAAAGGISSRARPDPARRRPAGGGLEGAIRPPGAVFFLFCLRQWRDRNSLGRMGKKSSRKSPLERRRTTPKQPAGAAPGTPKFAHPTMAALDQGFTPPSARETVGNRPALRRIFDDSLIILLLCSAEPRTGLDFMEFHEIP